jgi:hypothetical protein
MGTLTIAGYFAIGAAGAAWVVRRDDAPRPAGLGSQLAEALAMLLLWPLWAPFVLSSSKPPRDPLVLRLVAALDEAATDAPLSSAELALIRREVNLAEARMGALESGAAGRLAEIVARDRRNLVALAESIESLNAEMVFARLGSSETEALVTALVARLAALRDMAPIDRADE